MRSPVLLGVNIDHVATVRQARGTVYPDPVEAMRIAEAAGADGITVHLREDRRHIQERDVAMIKKLKKTRLNLEMAVTEAMIRYAEKIKPEHCCLVPEKRQELTTEGGLNVLSQEKKIRAAVSRLKRKKIDVSLFIDPDFAQIDAAVRTGAPTIELHTGEYADAKTAPARKKQLNRLIKAASHARKAGLIVNAGHGLTCDNVGPIARIPAINELNIGHAIVGRAIFVGLAEAVKEMKKMMEAKK